MEHTEAEIDSVISRQNVAKEGWTTYYVDGTDGNDGNNGLRWETAFKTIQHAIDTAESGAKIYVRPGTYDEQVSITKTAIRVIGTNAATVIVNTSTNGNAITVSAEFCTIKRLTAIGNGTGGFPDLSCGISMVGDRSSAEDCFVGNRDNGGFSCGVILANSDRCVIRNTKIATGYVPGVGLILYGAQYSTLEKNIIIGCQHENISVINSPTQTAQYNHIFENTCDGNAVSDDGIYIGNGPVNNFVYHNNCYNNTNNAIDTVANANRFFENYYSDHTTDINNDGLCDSPRTTGNVNDYSPVSKLNGWNQVSLGTNTGTAIAISNIFSIVNALLTLTETGGVVATNGANEVDVYINNAPVGVYDPKIIQIDFSNQTAGETVVIREYYRIEATGGLIMKHEVTFTGVQNPLLKNVTLEQNRFGVKVTMQKTVGTNRDYDFEVIYKI